MLLWAYFAKVAFMAAKKILIFSIVYYPQYVGGAEVAVKEITDRISSSECEFHVIALRRSAVDAREEKIGNTIVHRIGWPIFKDDIVAHHPAMIALNKICYPINAWWTAITLHRTNNFQATWSIMANYSGLAAYFFKRTNPSVPFILSLQEGDSEEHLTYRWGGLISLTWKLTLARANFVAAISNYLLQRATTIGFKGTAHVIPNGVSVDSFSEKVSAEERILLRKKIGLSDDVVALITSSRLTIKNGVRDVIVALTILPPRVKFVICGVGELDAELKKLVAKHRLEDRVFFVGFVDHARLKNYLDAADIFIRPSLSEGFGSSFIEAMAAQIPVIATPVGGIVDFLIDAQTGYFCKPQDPRSIADTVNKVIADENKEKIIAHASEMVRTTYDWSHVAAEINEKIFSKV